MRKIFQPFYSALCETIVRYRSYHFFRDYRYTCIPLIFRMFFYLHRNSQYFKKVHFVNFRFIFGLILQIRLTRFICWSMTIRFLFFLILSILGEGIEGGKFSLMALRLFFSSYLSQREKESRLENHSIDREFDWPIEWKQNV